LDHFWNFISDPGEEAELWLEGEISSESWYEDLITPQIFKAELAQCSGPLTVWINSPGGDLFAASEIYTALKEYKGGAVTVKISSLAASAASIVAMAGSRVMMSPTAYMIIHNPWSIAIGNSDEMRRMAKELDEYAEGLITAYEIKTRMPRDLIAKLMRNETRMNAIAARDYGFVDEVMYLDALPFSEPPLDADEDEDEDEDEHKSDEESDDDDDLLHGEESDEDDDDEYDKELQSKSLSKTIGKSFETGIRQGLSARNHTHGISIQKHTHSQNTYRPAASIGGVKHVTVRPRARPVVYASVSMAESVLNKMRQKEQRQDDTRRAEAALRLRMICAEEVE
jgi:ATP-dependent Clp protease protease subunit